MSPSRAQSDPVGEQQQHHRRLTSTILKLTVLARGSNLQGYAEAVEWVNNLSALCCKLPEDQARFDAHSQLLASLYSAISNGLKQLLLNWPDELCARQHRVFCSAVRSVDCLCFNLGFFQFSQWFKKNAHKACGLAVKTGFLEQISPFMSHLLLILQPLQQARAVSEQQYTDIHDKIVCLATTLLNVWCALLQSWPECRFPDSLLAPTVGPAARLALTLITVTSAQVQIADSRSNIHSSSSINSSSSDLGKASKESSRSEPDSWRSACKTSLRISEQLLRATYHQCCADCNSKGISSSISIAAAAVLSADVQKMLLLGLAASAAMLHQQYSSRPAAVQATVADTPDAPTQPAGPQHGHLQLLTELGFSTPLDAELGEIARDALYGAHTLAGPQHHQIAIKVVDYLYDNSARQHEQTGDNTAACSRQQPEDGIAACDLLQQLAFPVLHTLKDMIMVSLDSSVEDSILMLRSFTYVLLSGIHLYVLQQRQQIWQWLLHSMYEKVRDAARNGSQQQQSDSRSGTPVPVLETRVVQAWVAATSTAFAFESRSQAPVADYVKDLMVQQPLTTLLAAETVARTTLGADKPQCLANLPIAMCQACLQSESSYASGILAQPHVQRQLASFLCSQLKQLMVTSTALRVAVVDEEQRLSSTCVIMQEVMLITCRLEAYRSAQNASAGQTAQQVADDTAHQQQLFTGWSINNWMAVFGRAMYASAARLLQQLAIDPGTAPPSRTVLKVWLVCVSVAYGVMVDSNGSDAALLEVKQHLRSFQQALTSAQPALADNTLQDARKQQLLLQLQHCGSAVCAALPVKFCCNNPACVNLARLTEQQLVAGKGSRCSGCKVARYCSRDCQLKHWKQHKKACKRIQQAEAAADGRRAITLSGTD